MKDTNLFKQIIFLNVCIILITIMTGCSKLKNDEVNLQQFYNCQASECHLSASLMQYPPTSGFHDEHLNSENHNITCSDCHKGYYNNSLHKNSIINGYNAFLKKQAPGDIVFFNIKNNSNATWSNISGTCDNMDCHNGQVSVEWYNTGNSLSCPDCHDGNSGSHAVHATVNNRGPVVPLTCAECHVGENYPLFEDGKKLSQTQVCNSCHSPGGAYNGVNSSDGSVGAKDNWGNGIYNGNTLRPGKEKWCAGCHDDSPSVIEGVTAPSVIGNESGISMYGATGYGYYKTGHGIPSTEKEVWTGPSGRNGAGLNCDSCHDFSLIHIDAKARSFDCNSNAEETCDATEYRTGYRLKLVDGSNPLEIPLGQNTGLVASHFKLCLQSGCHDPGPFIDSSNTNTNFGHGTRPDSFVNEHYRKLNMGSGPNPPRLIFYPDWRTIVHVEFPGTIPPGYPDGTVRSRTTCITCHNVHGTTRLSMLREGLDVVYYNDSTIDPDCSPPFDPPTPKDLTLDSSTGSMWRGHVRNICHDCHGNSCWIRKYDREPFPE